MRTHITQIVLDQSKGTISGATTDNARGLIAHLNQAFYSSERRFVLDAQYPFRQVTDDDHFGQGPIPSLYPLGDCPVKILMRWQPDQVGAGNALSNPRGEIVAKLAGPFFPSDWEERQGLIYRHTTAHEILHCLGAVTGDWVYKLWTLRDPTATLLPPERKIWGFDPGDWFHGIDEHRDWDLGFMSGNMANPDLRMDELSRRIALGSYRSPAPLPPLSNQFSVIIRDRVTKEPVADAQAFVIHIDINGQGGWRLLQYSRSSHFRMPWSINMSTLYSEPARLIKVYAPGYRPGFAWYCVGDAQAASMTGGSQMFVVEMDKVPDGTPVVEQHATWAGRTEIGRVWYGLQPGEFYAIGWRPLLGDSYPVPVDSFVARSASHEWTNPNPPKDGTTPYYTLYHLPHALLDALPPGTPPPPPGPRREVPERVATCEICNPPPAAPLRHLSDADARPAGPRERKA